MYTYIASTCPDGWDVFKGSCYSLYINPEVLTWNEAELLCQESHEGHLVSIRDQDEMVFLHYMISSQWEGTETETYIGKYLHLEERPLSYNLSYDNLRFS